MFGPGPTGPYGSNAYAFIQRPEKGAGVNTAEHIYLGNTFPRDLMHAWPQPKKQTPALTQGISNKMLMRMIIGSLLLMYYLPFSFIDRGDQYATFKKMKGQKNIS